MTLDLLHAFRVSEVAARLHVSRATVYRLISAGKLETIDPDGPGDMRVTAISLARYLGVDFARGAPRSTPDSDA